VYVGEEHPVVPRPPQELKGFKKLYLKAGESQEVQFTLPARAFSYFDASQMKWKVTPGTFQIHAGFSSRDIRASKKITITR
jgi:beta-glucosidase